MPLENKWCEKAFMCESTLLSFKGYIKVEFLSESAFDSLSLLQTPLVIFVLQDTMSWDDFPGSFISYLFFRSIPHRYFQFIFLLADLGSQIFLLAFCTHDQSSGPLFFLSINNSDLFGNSSVQNIVLVSFPSIPPNFAWEYHEC